MAVDRVSSPRQSLHTRALGRAVNLAWADIQKVHGRMTEELRAEDAIRGLELRGTEVHVLVDNRHEYKPDGLRDLVKGLMKKHGAAGARVELHKAPDLEGGVDKANDALKKIHNRRTREIRVLDGVSNFAAKSGSTVAVVLKARQPYDEASILRDARELLADAGLKNVKLEVIRPAIEPIRLDVLVAAANASIKEVQGRMTADMRAEDDVVNLSLNQASGDVHVVLKARPYHSEAQIGEAVQAHLQRAGFNNARLSYVRPAINPFDGPFIHPTRPGSPADMKKGVEKFAAAVEKVKARPTELLAFEHAIASVRLRGAKVEIKYWKNQAEAFGVDEIKIWAKAELKKLGVQLPVTFSVKDPRDV